MKYTKLAATLLCSVVLLCGCTKSTDVVLKVNDIPITRGEFYGDFKKILNSQFKQMKKSSSEEKKFVTLSVKDRYLDDVIVRALLENEFEKRKIEVSEDEIEAKKAELINRIGSEEEFQKILKENKISKERLHNDLANEVKIDKLAALAAPKTVSDSEIKAFYNANKEQFQIPETVHVYHILFSTNPEEIKRKIVDADKDAQLSDTEIEEKVKEETAKQEKLIEEVYAKASKNPKDFEKLAKEYSQDTGSKEKGGDLGYVTRFELVKEFGDAAFNQKKGTITRVKSPFGEHIIYVTDKKPAGTKQFSEVKDELKTFLEQDIKGASLRNLVGELREKAKIEYVEEDLKPEELKKQLEEAQKKYVESQRRQVIPDSKQKIIDKMESDKASKEEPKAPEKTE